MKPPHSPSEHTNIDNLSEQHDDESPVVDEGRQNNNNEEEEVHTRAAVPASTNPQPPIHETDENHNKNNMIDSSSLSVDEDYSEIDQENNLSVEEHPSTTHHPPTAHRPSDLDQFSSAGDDGQTQRIDERIRRRERRRRIRQRRREFQHRRQQQQQQQQLRRPRRNNDRFVTIGLVLFAAVAVAPLAFFNRVSETEDTKEEENSYSQNQWSVQEIINGERKLISYIVTDQGHSCAIHELGGLFCWGTQVEVPAIFARGAFDEDNDRRDSLTVAIGDGFTCALVPTRKSLHCWGDHRKADLVQPPEDLVDFEFVTASGGTVCAIAHLRAMDNDWNSTIPEAAEGLSFSELDLNLFSRNATDDEAELRIDGTAQEARCWGYFQDKRVELSIPSVTSPFRMLAIPKGENWRHICAIVSEHATLQCWEVQSDSFELKEVTTLNYYFEPLHSIAVMENFVCGIQQDDFLLKCWVFEVRNELNLPNIPPATTFQQVVPGPDNFFCAVTEQDGMPICFGANREPVYALTSGPCCRNNYDGFMSLPYCVDTDGIPAYVPAEIGPISQLVIGERQMCAIRREDGSGVCWGTPNRPNQLAPLSNYSPIFGKQVALGESRTCSIHHHQRRVDCWGRDRFQLLVRALDLSVGNQVTCAVDTSDRRAKCIISDGIFEIDGKVENVIVSPQDIICTYGESEEVRCFRTQCRRISFPGNYECHGDPQFPGNPDSQLWDIKKLTLQRQHYCAILRDDRLQCGPFNSAAIDLAALPQAQVPEDLQSIRDVAIGHSFSCAVLISHEIRCWGDSEQFGDEFVLNPPIGPYYKAVAATDYEACAITLDDLVHCWGRPFRNALYVPREVQFVNRLEAGSGHFCALMASEQILCWGSNQHGELSPQYSS